MSGTESGRIPPAPLVVALAVFAVAGAVAASWRPMNGDASWYVYVAGRLLEGDRLYVDLIDTNPPLILWLNMGIVGAARAIGVAPLAAFRAGVFALIGVSLALSWRTSRGVPEVLRQASLATFGYMLFVGVGPAFGQREHLMMALVLPYAYAASAEARGERTPRRLAVVTGLMAGLGFALKPFFVPAALAVELILAARRGPRVWIRPQALAMGVVGIVYGVLLLILTPQYLDVARRFAPLYPAHNPMGSTLVANSWRLLVVVGSTGLAWGVCRRCARGWAEVFLLLDLWLTVAVYLTGKGWDYHWFPSMALSWAMVLGALAMIISGWEGSRRRLVVALGAGLALIAPALALLETASRLPDRETGRVVRSRTNPGDAVFVLSPWLHKAFPMVMDSGVTWGHRYPMLLSIAAFYPEESWEAGRYHALGAMSEPERRFLGEVSADFLRSRPALLLVDDDPPTPLHRGFRYLDYFALDPAFTQALGEYEYFKRTPSFVVYRRRDASPETALAGITRGRSSRRIQTSD
jgi:hypothetical protein